MLNCELCLNYSHSKFKHTPGHFWIKIATDIFNFEGSSYLLILAYTSQFLVVCKLSSMTGLHVANQCKQVVSEYEWLRPWFQLMVHAIPHKPSPLLCSPTVSIILPALWFTYSKTVLLRSISRLVRTCSTKLKKQAKIFPSV